MVSTVRGVCVRIIVGIVALVLAGTLLPAAGAAAKPAPVVPAALFGMHYHSVSKKEPTFRAGAIRLWDSGVAWKRLNPAPGRYTWGPLDRAVANARQSGAREIQYVFGVTPQWAAASPRATSLYGPGTSSPPRHVSSFTAFAGALAKRYKGVITSYEMWNEGSLKVFFSGTAKQLADMTISGARAIRAASPRAVIVAPSTTYGVFHRRPKFWGDFAKRLRAAGWPVNAVSIHPYGKRPDYLKKRERYINKARTFYRKYGFRGPIWDTEINYGDRRGLFEGFKQISYSGPTAAGMVARTYVDAMRMGVPRVFWYGWDYHQFGIDMVDPATQRTTLAGQAFLTTQQWMVGKRWLGCTVRAKIRRCGLVDSKGARSTIVYATSKTRTLTVPRGATALQGLDGRSMRVVAGQKVRVGAIPVLLLGV
jgi:hypothetical protein